MTYSGKIYLVLLFKKGCGLPDGMWIGEIRFELLHHLVDGDIQLRKDLEGVAVTVGEGCQHEMFAGDHRRIETCSLARSKLKDWSKLFGKIVLHQKNRLQQIYYLLV